MNVPFLIGRLAFGSFFVYNGINHIRNRKGLAQYAGSKKVPMPDAGVTISGLALIAGGASIISGYRPKYGSAALIGFLAAVSPVMHDFWNAEDPNQKANDMAHFMKNMALLGAAVALMGVEEPWPAALAAEEPSRMDRVISFAREKLAA